MFGIKIISEERYQSEQSTANKLMKINEELTKKNIRLELDIKDLREQNTKLRSINGKRLDENNALVVKTNKYKVLIKEHQAFREDIKKAFPGIDFRHYKPVLCDHKCTGCPAETDSCVKYTNLSVCMVAKDSFRTNPNQ